MSHVAIQLKCGVPGCGIVGPGAPVDDAGDAWRWLDQHSRLIHRSDVLIYHSRYIDLGRTASAWTQSRTG